MIEHIEVDGVPAVFAKRSGPTAAGLLFRVGIADETLARSGITHMVEHLALHRLGLTGYHSNGLTSGDTTQFVMTGSGAEVVTFFQSVCAALRDLPVERLETEKAVLRTEAGEHGVNMPGRIMAWRHGARGLGLRGYPEWGVGALSADEVRAWARTWFTRQNALLWIRGEQVPEELRLDLPDGTHRPQPVAEPLPHTFPAYVAAGQGRVWFDGVVRRGMAGVLLARVLERELFHALRQEGGYSYTATAGYAVRGAESAGITAIADALPEQQDAVLGGVVDVLARFRAGVVPAEEVETARAQAEAALSGPDVDANRLVAYATDLICGRPAPDVEEIREELRQVTPEGVHAAALEALDSALLVVPEGRRADWAGFTELSARSGEAVQGATYFARAGGETKLVIGAEAVSLAEPARVRTVRFAECAAMLCWPDGARRVVGADGTTVPIEPSLFHLTPGALNPLDAAVDAARRVPMPARAADEIPQPPPPPAPGVPARRAVPPWWRVFLVPGLLGLLALGATVGMLVDGGGDAHFWFSLLLFWGLTLVTAWRRYEQRHALPRR